MARPYYIKKLLYGQRGGVAILFVLCLPVLLGFAALAVDLARINLTRVELQNAADAAVLAGARSLSDPSVAASDKPYNWTAATITALDVVQHNYANAALLHDAIIETGYLNLQDPSLGLRTSGTPGGDVPAIRVTVALSSTQNNGPLQLFFAPILGIAERNIQASAIAVIAAPAAGKGLFPMVISKHLLDIYWNSTTRTPILVNGVAPTVKIGTIYSINGVSQLWGQWTTFSIQNNNVPAIRTLIQYGNPTELAIGDLTYIQPGAEATLYKTGSAPDELHVGDVAVFVVDEVVTGSYQPIIAIAGFHISGSNQGKKYVEGYFINNVPAPGTNPGAGNGVPYGAYTPPILVE